MAVSVELVRPDDLLHLHVKGENLRLDTAGTDGPELVLDDATRSGYLIVNFPPQAVVEEAVYQSSPTPPLSDEAGAGYNQPPPSPPDVPAVTRSRIGRPSRLVFRIPAGSTRRIPFSIAGLLDWSALELSVSPLAALPAEPTLSQRRTAPVIAEPGANESAIELPYRLVLSPNGEATWRHSLQPSTHSGATALWHTRLALRDGAQGVIELSRAQPAPLRAIWSPDYNRHRFVKFDEPRFGESDKDWPGGTC